MKSPFTGKEMTIQKEWRTMSFRKDHFRILFHSYKCEETGEQFEDELFAELNYNQLVNQYREKYSILFPEQIKSIREKYAVSATKMSEILGFGINCFRQYENGEVPSQSNSRLIQLADDPHEFKKLLDLCNSIDSKGKEKLNHRIQTVLEEQKNSKVERFFENYFFEVGLPNSLTGYRTPSLNKFAEMVVFFTEMMQPWKTKLNKLLFYSDFNMYRQTGFSISGAKYIAIPMGPVPNNFNSIFEYLANNDEIEIYYSAFSDGGIGEQFKPNRNRKFNPDVFSRDELHILETINDKFKNTSTNEIIDISHREKGWIDSKSDKTAIDYIYSFDLN